MCQVRSGAGWHKGWHIVCAAQKGRLDLVQAAVASGIDVNSRWAKNSTPLMAASRFGHLVVVQFLLEHGADVNLWDTDYATALDHAQQCGSLDTVSLLRTHGGQAGSSFLLRRCWDYVQKRSSTALLVVCFCGLLWLALGLERCVLALATTLSVSVPIYVFLRTRKRVDFFIVGAQKAGTSALWTYLVEHPAVYLSKEKELHFFDDDARFLLTNPVATIIRELQYHTCFGGFRDGAKVFGEVTPIYCWWRGALERIAAYNPKAKIIMLMRDPVSRAYSHWNMNGQQGWNPYAFVDALEIERSGTKLRQPPEPRIRDYIHDLLAPPCRALPTASSHQHKKFSYVERGRYARQIVELRRLFPEDQLLFMKYEQFCADEQKGIDDICNFLGVDPMTISPAEVHKRSYNAPMPTEVRRDLIAHLLPDIEQVEKLLGWDCSDWKAEKRHVAGAST